MFEAWNSTVDAEEVRDKGRTAVTAPFHLEMGPEAAPGGEESNPQMTISGLGDPNFSPNRSESRVPIGGRGPKIFLDRKFRKTRLTQEIRKEIEGKGRDLDVRWLTITPIRKEADPKAWSTKQCAHLRFVVAAIVVIV